MSKRFRCGRVMLMKDGKIKKVGLEKGGGSRFCDWYDNDMNFDDVRDRLITLFNLGDTEYEILLYDYQLRPLDLDQYETVLEYIYNNGLNCNSTVIYLCTREVDDRHSSKKVMMKKKKKHQTKPNSSRTPIEHKPLVKSEPDADLQQIHSSLLEYSFKNASYDLVKTTRDLINQNSFDELLIQLFENCCLIHGYICATIDPLQRNQYFQSRNQSEYSNNLNDISNICQSIETLVNLNKDKFDQMEQFSVIQNLFIKFDENLKILRDQWSEYIKKNKFEGTSSSHIHSTSSEDQIDTITKTPHQETYALFQLLLNSATDLLDIMNTSRLSSFRSMVKSIIIDLESLRSNVNLYNYQSLCNAKQAVTSFKIRYTRKFNQHAFTSSIYQISRPVKQGYQKTLRAICDLLTALRQYQLQTGEHDQPNNSKSSSISLSNIRHEQAEDNQLTQPKKIKLEKFHNDHNHSMDVAVYSSADIQ